LTNKGGKKMSITEKTPKQEKPIVYNMVPDYYTNFDSISGKWQIEMHLPGVKKENILIRVLPDLYDIQAKRNETEIYSLSEYFPFEVNPGSVKAQYNNGLLVIQGEVVNPLEKGVEVKIE